MLETSFKEALRGPFKHIQSSALEMFHLTTSHSSAMNSFQHSAYSLIGEMKEIKSLRGRAEPSLSMIKTHQAGNELTELKTSIPAVRKKISSSAL